MISPTLDSTGAYCRVVTTLLGCTALTVSHHHTQELDRLRPLGGGVRLQLLHNTKPLQESGRGQPACRQDWPELHELRRGSKCLVLFADVLERQVLYSQHQLEQ